MVRANNQADGAKPHRQPSKREGFNLCMLPRRLAGLFDHLRSVCEQATVCLSWTTRKNYKTSACCRILASLRLLRAIYAKAKSQGWVDRRSKARGESAFERSMAQPRYSGSYK